MHPPGANCTSAVCASHHPPPACPLARPAAVKTCSNPVSIASAGPPPKSSSIRRRQAPKRIYRILKQAFRPPAGCLHSSATGEKRERVLQREWENADANETWSKQKAQTVLPAQAFVRGG